MDSAVLDIDTTRRRTVDLTDQVREFCRARGADHVLPGLVPPSITFPVAAGRPLLGTWHSVILVDLNGVNPRRTARLVFVAG